MRKVEAPPIMLPCALLIGLTVMVGACMQPHVRLQLPPRTASSAVRVAAYQAHRPRRVTSVHTTQIGGGPHGMHGGGSSTEHFLRLNNGMLIYHPEDLRSAVAPDSQTAQLIVQSRRKKRLGRIIEWTGGGVAVAGAIIALAQFKPMVNGEGNAAFFWTGVGAFVAGAIAGMIGAYQIQTGRDIGRDAFETFDRDLQAYLRVEAQYRVRDASRRPAAK